jgi:hypothetical protein|tara:strand:- start:3748 stop:4593 length:846 start_codon:yes stop_codon:yes gene_type:complete
MSTYNVVKDYDWTSSPRGSAMRQKAPKVQVRSYRLKSNQILQAIQGFIAIGSGGDGDSFYDKLYEEATESEDNFRFPFFGDDVRSFGNTFGDTFQDGIGGSGGIAGKLYEGARQLAGGAAQAVNLGRDAANTDFGDVAKKIAAGNISGAAGALGGSGNPGTYVESPMFYQFDKSDGPLAVEFVVSNTINADSIEKNHKLVQKLTEINRPLRKDSISVDPPRIYKVKVPGQRFIRWAYCESFSVNLVGTRREINNVIVPEAYKISMSFKSLTLEHAGFVKKA